jgi:trigger factor
MWMSETDSEKTAVTNETGENQTNETEPLSEPVSQAEQAPAEETPAPASDGEAKNELEHFFTIEVSREEIAEAFDQLAEKYTHEVKMPGFRRGKVPLEVIKSRFEGPIKEEVLNTVIQEAVKKKIEEDGIKAASPSVLQELDYEDGGDLKADMMVEVFPTIELPDFESTEVEIPAAELKYDDYDEEKQIDRFLEGNSRRTLVVSRPVKDGDQVTLKYQSKILQTKRMTPRKEANYVVKETEKFEILDLYKEIIDKKVDDTITLQRTYPEDYEKKAWAGKEIEHYITIQSIFEMVKPELNEEFLKSLPFEGDVPQFKERLKEEYEKHHQGQIEEKKINLVISRLAEMVTFALPRSLVEEETSRLQAQYGGQIKFTDKKQEEEFRGALRQEAERSLKVSLLTDAIREKYRLDVTNDDLEAQYKIIAEQNNLPLKDVRKAYMNKKEYAGQLKASLLNDKIKGLLNEKVKIKEV